MTKTDPLAVAVGDIVRGYSQTTNTVITMIVDIIRHREDGALIGVTGRQLNEDGTVKDRKKRFIALHLPGVEDGFKQAMDISTGKMAPGGWEYHGITLRRADEQKRGKWANPLKALGVGATLDIDCTLREVQTIRVAASVQGGYWNKRFKVEKTLTGCAVTRTV